MYKRVYYYAGERPTVFDLIEGEECLNTVDKLVYVRTATDIISYPYIDDTLASKDYVDSFLPNQNYLNNSNFDIWGRATSQTVSGFGSDDRWKNIFVGGSVAHSRVVNDSILFSSTFFSRSIVVGGSVATDYAIKRQFIENVQKLAGKIVSISFLAKANAPKKLAIEFEQNFGTGGTPSTYVTSIGMKSFDLTTTWQKFTHTFVLPSIVGKTLGTDGIHTSYTLLNFWMSSSTNYNTRASSIGVQSGTFDIGQVKLEEGSFATPYVWENIVDEKTKCERYFRRFTKEAFPSTFCSVPHINNTYIGPMRVNPTLSSTVDDGSGATYSTRYGYGNVEVYQTAFNSIHAIATISLSSEF